MIRLQGEKFSKLKDELRLVNYQMSHNRRIRVNLALKNSNPDKVIYYHWLNNEETVRFLKSDYFKQSIADIIRENSK